MSDTIEIDTTKQYECFGCEREVPYEQVAYAFESLFFGHIVHKYVCKPCEKNGLTTKKAMKMDSGDDDTDEDDE